ncbi:hypothetical protein B0H13DRAFT_2261048 [Mycena leptocephala]|nr:hypothetical protein B0H13DRAFT_2261048 [Mycena leptocephala]
MLATSIPQIFQFIPNPLQIEIPPDSNSLPPIKHHPSSPSLSQDDFPSVAFWNRADFTQSDSDLTSISDDKSSLSSLSFLEHANGECFDTAEIDSVRGHIQAAFITLLDRGLAPTTWSHASSVAVNWLRTEMLTYSPDLGLCSGNWKINMMATIVYSQWSRRRREKIASQVKAPVAVKTTTGSKRKSQEESDSSIAPKKSKITASSHNSHRRPNPSAVARTRTNQTAKKTTTLDPKVKKNAVAVTKSRAHTPHPSHSPTPIPLSLRDSSSRSPSPALLAVPSNNTSPSQSRVSSPSPRILSSGSDDDIELALEEDQRAASVPARTPTALVSPRTNPKRRITIVNPLDGLFGETPVPPVSRLKPRKIKSSVLMSLTIYQAPQISIPVPDASGPPPPPPPSAPPPLPSSTEPAPSQPLPEPAPASSSATSTSPTQSVSLSASTPAPPAQVVAASDSSAGDAPAVPRKPLKPYRPGTADTARHLFAREHMQKNPKHTTPEVKEAYNALDNKAKKVYEDEAKRLKQLKKAADKPDKKREERNPNAMNYWTSKWFGRDRVNIRRKDSCTSQLGCVGPKRKLHALASHHHSRRSPPVPAGSIMGICKPKVSPSSYYLKHDDEVLRHGGISYLAAQIKGDAARGASHGVMDIEDVHGVYCSGVAIPEPGTGSASCPHRYASPHHLPAIQGICGEVVQSGAYVRYGTGLTAKKDSEVKITHRAL